MTYPALYGVERARQQAHDLIGRACDALAFWPTAGRLRALAAFIETRLS